MRPAGGKYYRFIDIFAARGYVSGLFDSLLISRYGESSGEPRSVMILNPAFGNILEKQ
jgi:hypothetical protein